MVQLSLHLHKDCEAADLSFIMSISMARNQRFLVHTASASPVSTKLMEMLTRWFPNLPSYLPRYRADLRRVSSPTSARACEEGQTYPSAPAPISIHHPLLWASSPGWKEADEVWFDSSSCPILHRLQSGSQLTLTMEGFRLFKNGTTTSNPI